jgi:hypothetical protein
MHFNPMNKTSLISSAAGIALLLASAAPALADESGTHASGTSVTASTSVGVHSEENSDGKGNDQNNNDHMDNGSSTEKHMQKGEDKAGHAIDVRIKSLQELSVRLAGLKLLSPEVLASIQASLNAEIQNLITLKAKIASDTSTTTLKADADSITKANRVYLLVEPKARIASAASRVNAVVTQFQALATKLQARITAAQTAGTDVSVAVTAMTDFNAKIADAKTQADAAVAETANLKADNGDKTVLAANLAALKDARTKLANAEKDLAAARHDAATVYSVVKGKNGGEGDGHASTTVETH